MSKITILYYTTISGVNPVEEFLDSLQKSQKAKIFRIFEYIKEYGLTTAIPHIKKLAGTPLWEIRTLGQDNIRVLYVTLQTESILLVHGFIKKSQKTPEKEISTALNRIKDYQNRETYS